MRELIMRTFVVVFVAIVSNWAVADELTEAYQKEYAYLVAEKKAIEQRLASLNQQQHQTLAQLRSEIAVLEKQYLEGQNQAERLNQRIVEASRSSVSAESDNQLLNTTLLQAEEALTALNQPLNENASQIEQLNQAFALAASVIAADSSVTTEPGQYFKQDGESIAAQVMSVGRIAKFGLQDGAEGMLYPSGNGRLSLWNVEASPNTAKLAAGQMPPVIELFLYDDINKAIEKRDDKGFMDDVAAGGLIGKVILVLGALGFLFVVIRALYLVAFSSDIKSVAGDVQAALSEKNKEKALSLFNKGKGSAHRVMAKTVENLGKERDHLEDIVSESILNERSKIDKFAAVILVFAAVSPLLGLLGTVTGMITTFDIITEFGTGDPKLLSSGISEALITTKFGLMVAIPLLLFGNVLSSWGNRIKNNLEQSALNVINTYKA